jgi:hypothetical protein
MGCDQYGKETIPLRPYTRAHYLINGADSAKTIKDANPDYIWNSWVRLVFVDAIHAGDTLYIIKDSVKFANDVKELYGRKKGEAETARSHINIDEFIKYAKSDAGKKVVTLVPLDVDNVTHNNYVFSFRLIERGGTDFLIESEPDLTSTTTNTRQIGPCMGGWIKIQNGVPVLSQTRTDAGTPQNGMEQGARFNLEVVTGDDAYATGTQDVAATNVTVVGNTGSITILNAAGKSVVVNNILGQTIVNTVLSSDNTTIAAPKGIVIVAVEGEAAVKALVK